MPRELGLEKQVFGILIKRFVGLNGKAQSEFIKIIKYYIIKNEQFRDVFINIEEIEVFLYEALLIFDNQLEYKQETSQIEFIFSNYIEN